MEEAIADPLDVSKEPQLIKDAQSEMEKMDILVCGVCTEIFHFVEEFQKHKADQCKNVSNFKCENSEKPQVWGFTLWKSKQMKSILEKQEENPTPWEIYQRWCKLSQSEKNAWISAGQGLQFSAKISSAKLLPANSENKLDKDPLSFEDTEIKNTSSNEVKTNGKENRGFKNENEKEEFVVENIISKRFNPRHRYWEYEVKWKNYEETTFEPLIHLENCKELVSEFEEKYKLQKEKEKQSTTPRGRGRPRLQQQQQSLSPKVQTKKPQVILSPIITTPGGRPQRSSKQKALSQVKQWCGSISDEESGGKRTYDEIDDDSDDSFEKKLKLDAESEDTEEEIDKITSKSTSLPIRKVAKIVHSYNNGLGNIKKLPDNVLIPDAKGVVRISQKQLPALSSGVYIMSKSSGIIKLDAAASKIATSGGQAIVKVNPKVGGNGQTEVKIIKKDIDLKSRFMLMKQQSVKTTTTTPPTKIIKHVAQKTSEKKITTLPQTPTQRVYSKDDKKLISEQKNADVNVQNDDDDDDGLEEMEFPTDLPLPEPDSPPGEFILDPITGKIIGQSDDVSPQKSTETIDNIVKLAAADITEDDLKPDEPIDNKVSVTPKILNNSATITTPTTNKNDVYSVVSTSTSPAIIKTTATVGSKVGQSILNKAIANSNILQKTLQSPRTQKIYKPQQQITKPRQVNSLIRNIKTTTTTTVQQKPKFNISPAQPSIRNVYTKSNNITKKIGNTSIYKTIPKTTTTTIKNNVEKKEIRSPKPAISMPSLNDDEPVQIQKPEPVTKVPATIVTASPEVQSTTTVTEAASLPEFTLADTDHPVFITGDDGTVYQVAGQNEDGQTILLTQDSDGQQQCLLVTNEISADDIQQHQQVISENADGQGQMVVEGQEELELATDEQPVVAQFIRTEPPSPGGTHKVVVMLPDGECMVTQVTPEEYASLELGK